MRPPSLSAQLSWRLGAIQIATFITSLLIVMFIIWDPSRKEVPRKLAEDVASAIDRRDGQLVIVRDQLPRGFLDDEATAWVVARSSDGDTLVYGRVPSEFDSVIAALPRFHGMQFRSDDVHLAATAVTQFRQWGTLWTAVGGTPERGFLSDALLVMKYAGLLVFLPVLLATLLLVPLAIRRSLRTFRTVASSAANINLDRAGGLLPTADLPGELRPLADSFNDALARIWEASSSRDRFLADAAHELRMPLAVLRTRLSGLPHSTEKLRLLSDMARLENIAGQLLDLQRLSRRVAPRTAIDLFALCDALAAEVAPVILDEGYTFSFRADGEPVFVLGDPTALERMFKNLLHNAVIHAGHSGEIAFQVDEGGRVTVADNGPGVALEERERIFSPFYRLDTPVNGSGLGLHLAREVAALHGGRIRVSDGPGGGALFEVLLPVMNAPQGVQQRRGGKQ